jgi:hypothetical protein
MFRYELDNPDFECRPGQKFPHSRKRQTSLSPTQTPIQWVGNSYFGVRRPGPEADN